MSQDRRPIVAEGLFPDPMQTLASGDCVGLVRDTLGKPVLTVAMDVTETEKDAYLTINTPLHYTLTDATKLITSLIDYGMEDCQDCTLYATLDSNVRFLDKSPIKVKVKKTKGCHGVATYVIR